MSETYQIPSLTNEQIALIKAEERVDYLFREEKYIIQSPYFFPFSMDAILLADFVVFPRRRNLKVIDFCCGGGIIPLLLSNRTDQKIVGIEYQADIVDMAQRSVKLNDLQGQLEIIQGDINDLKKPELLYDVVTCNPPFFTVNESFQLRELDSHAIARHEVKLSLKQWVSKAALVLREKGKLFIVYRPNRLDDLIETLMAHQFAVNRLQFVHPKSDLNANMVLVEAIYRGGRQGVKVEPSLVVHHADGSYTDAMKGIYFGNKK